MAISAVIIYRFFILQKHISNISHSYDLWAGRAQKSVCLRQFLVFMTLQSQICLDYSTTAPVLYCSYWCRQSDSTNFKFGNGYIRWVFDGPAVKALLYFNKSLVIFTLLHCTVHLVQNILAAFIRLLQQLILSGICCNISTAIHTYILLLLKIRHCYSRSLQYMQSTCGPIILLVALYMFTLSAAVKYNTAGCVRPMSDTQQSWASLSLNFIAQQICLGNSIFHWQTIAK